jgi:hypothetical protein
VCCVLPCADGKHQQTNLGTKIRFPIASVAGVFAWLFCPHTTHSDGEMLLSEDRQGRNRTNAFVVGSWLKIYFKYPVNHLIMFKANCLLSDPGVFIPIFPNSSIVLYGSPENN